MEYTILMVVCTNGGVFFLVVDTVDRSVFWTTSINLATRLSAQAAGEYVQQIKDRSIDRPVLARTLTVRRYKTTDEAVYTLD